MIRLEDICGYPERIETEIQEMAKSSIKYPTQIQLCMNCANLNCNCVECQAQLTHTCHRVCGWKATNADCERFISDTNADGSPRFPQPFRQVCRIGVVRMEKRTTVILPPVFVKIVWDENFLCIYGVVGPCHRSAARGPDGDIRNEVRRIEKFARGWTAEMRDRLVSYWDLYPQGSYMRLCNHQQDAHLNYYDDYGKVCKECGHKLGQKWFAMVPTETLAWLQNLPNPDRDPIWI